jgi:hypothetical protein
VDVEKVLEHLKQLHREIEVDAGKDPNRVSDTIIPLDELEGFDSNLVPNMIRALAKAMGIILPKGVRLRNPYVGKDKKHLTLRQVAERFCELYGSKGKAA